MAPGTHATPGDLETVAAALGGRLDQLKADQDSQATTILGVRDEVRAARDRLEGHIANHGTPPPDPDPDPDPPTEPPDNPPPPLWFNPNIDSSSPTWDEGRTKWLYTPIDPGVSRSAGIPLYEGHLNINFGPNWIMPHYDADESDPPIQVRVRDAQPSADGRVYYRGATITIAHFKRGVPISGGTDANIAMGQPDGTTWDLYGASFQADGSIVCSHAGRFDRNGSAWRALEKWPKHIDPAREATEIKIGSRAAGIFPPFGNLPATLRDYEATGLPFVIGVGGGPRILGPASTSAWQFPAYRADRRAAETYQGQNKMGSRFASKADYSGAMRTAEGRALARTTYHMGMLLQDFAGAAANITLYAQPGLEPRLTADGIKADFLADIEYLSAVSRLVKVA